MQETGEFVAQQVDHGRPMATATDRGPIVLLGTIPSFPGLYDYSPRLFSALESDRRLLRSWSLDLPDVVLGDTLALTKDPDFMDVMAGRIAVATRLLGALFRNPESTVYDIPLAEINKRIAAGEVNVASI